MYCCRCAGGSCNHIGECTDCGNHGPRWVGPPHFPLFTPRAPWQCPGCKAWSSPYVERCGCVSVTYANKMPTLTNSACTALDTPTVSLTFKEEQ